MHGFIHLDCYDLQQMLCGSCAWFVHLHCLCLQSAQCWHSHTAQCTFASVTSNKRSAGSCAGLVHLHCCDLHCCRVCCLQERASLLQGQLPSFLAGTLPDAAGDSSKNKKELMQQVQEYLAGWQQVSAAMCCWPTSFWVPLFPAACAS